MRRTDSWIRGSAIKMRSLSVTLFMLSALPYISSECERLDACSCVFSDGTGIDLNPSNRTLTAEPLKFLKYNQKTEATNAVITTVITYYFFPCKNNVLKIDGKTAPAGCDKSLAICREEITEKRQLITGKADQYNVSITKDYQQFGSNEVTAFDNAASAIIYSNPPSKTYVLLACAPADDTFTVDDEELNNVTFTLYSRHACLREIRDVHARSTGSTLLIVFFTLILLYLVLGVCTKRFLMGAQGVEVIPNVSFWRDLPALCRDGWVFLRNGCKVPPDAVVGPAPGDPNSYDSI